MVQITYITSSYMVANSKHLFHFVDIFSIIWCMHPWQNVKWDCAKKENSKWRVFNSKSQSVTDKCIKDAFFPQTRKAYRDHIYHLHLAFASRMQCKEMSDSGLIPFLCLRFHSHGKIWHSSVSLSGIHGPGYPGVYRQPWTLLKSMTDWYWLQMYIRNFWN